MKNATTILGLYPEQLFERMWRMTDVHRKLRGEATNYIWGHGEPTAEQESELERSRVMEDITIGLMDDSGEIIPIEFQVTAHRIKETDAKRLYRDFIVMLTCGDEEHYHVKDAIYMREYLDSDMDEQRERELDNWKNVFSTFITSANLVHYKNRVRDVRASQELFKDNVYAMMDTYLK